MMPSLILALALLTDGPSAFALDFQDREATHSCKASPGGDAIAALSNQNRDDLKAACIDDCASQAKKFRKPFYFPIADTQEKDDQIWASLTVGKTSCWLPLGVLKTTKINEGSTGRGVACASGQKAGMLGSHDCQGE